MDVSGANVIVLDRDLWVYTFPSSDDAELNLEEPDVINGEYEGYFRSGERTAISVTPDGVRVAGTGTHDMPQLLRHLGDALERRDLPLPSSDDDQEFIDEALSAFAAWATSRSLANRLKQRLAKRRPAR